MPLYIAALLIGVIAGLRAFVAPAAVSWAARLGWLPIGNSWAAFMGYACTPYEVRIWLAKAFGKEMPAAFIEDAVALVGAGLIVSV